MATSPFSLLNYDLTERILSLLPIPSLISSSLVCRQWLSIVSHPSFPSPPRPPWFFLFGAHNLLPYLNQAFAFDPESHQWLPLPPIPLFSHTLLPGHAGFFFSLTPSPTRLAFAPLLSPPIWTLTPPLPSPRCNPLLAAMASPSGPRFILAGGSRYVGGMVDIEDPLDVEIYDPRSNSWETGPPFPAAFTSNNWLSSCMLSSPRLFFVAGIYSGAVSAFNLASRSWTPVQTLRPPGVVFSYLLTFKDDLLLAGLCIVNGLPRFVLWGVDHRTMEFTEIGAMPRDLLACMFDYDDDDARFASLKCVGLDERVYVFNEDHHKGYPACVCEISGAHCTWKKVPPLPGRINQFHKVVAFCSAVPLRAVLAPAGDAGVVG